MSGQQQNADEQSDLTTLESRIRALEVEVYGYDPQRSAGEEAVVDMKRTIVFLENRYSPRDKYNGVPLEDVYTVVEVLGLSRSVAEQAYEKLRRQGEVYEPAIDKVRST